MPLLGRPRRRCLGASVNETPRGSPCPSGAAFGIALRGPWKLGAWSLGGAHGCGVRDPHPGVASTTPAVGLDPKAGSTRLALGHRDWTARCSSRRTLAPKCLVVGHAKSAITGAHKP